ncbi:biotin--[acetyl-CoA-carboxylase] ligase, partial [Oscillatoriales cyanobacterium LEGE 11467]|nr:biotin--[acetyl-CoA-carboxylase] ligase [Zarconia navalis LEGE 11467]
GLARGWQYWQQEGVESLVKAYETLLVNIGQSVEVEGKSGTVVGMDSDGNLRVRLTGETGEILPEICRSPGNINLGYDVASMH